jgi:hypothetical protein
MIEHVHARPTTAEVTIFDPSLRGQVQAFEAIAPEQVYFHRKNIICNGVSYLFGRLMSNPTSLISGVWGLAIGAGGTGNDGWSASTQPDPSATDFELISEIKRKQLSTFYYMDDSGNPTSSMTTRMAFQTILNATTDGIEVPIREMGLIGGGTTDTTKGGPTNMLTAPYLDLSAPTENTVVLINRITCPPFILPPDINMAIRWTIQF